MEMSSDAKQQAEENQVLHAIYDGYENFKEINPTTYQYKYGEGLKSFVLEIIWGPTYPSEKPMFNVEIFYNQDLIPSVKQKILSAADAVAGKWLGSAMTFSIFEELKDKVDELLEAQTEEAVAAHSKKIVITEQAGPSKKPDEDKLPWYHKEGGQPVPWRGWGRKSFSKRRPQLFNQPPQEPPQQPPQEPSQQLPHQPPPP